MLRTTRLICVISILAGLAGCDDSSASKDARSTPASAAQPTRTVTPVPPPAVSIPASPSSSETPTPPKELVPPAKTPAQDLALPSPPPVVAPTEPDEDIVQARLEKFNQLLTKVETTRARLLKARFVATPATMPAVMAK
jgi:hypothetical protein